MTLTPFHRLLEDVLREEILTMGLDYGSVVDRIIVRRDGEVFTIRFAGETPDLEIVEPDGLPTRTELGALLRRKLVFALHHGNIVN